MALTVAVACGGTQTPVASTSASPKAAVFDDKFGFLVGNTVRKEGDPKALFTLQAGKDEGFRVSPDGRQVAYSYQNELRVLDIAPGAQPRTLITLSSKENGFSIVWSSDGTGLLVGVSSSAPVPGDAPPDYTALRVIEAAGGQPRELARVAKANIVPLAWDRKARLIVAHEPVCCGTYRYDTLVEGGTIKRVPPGPALFFFQASGDAQQVFGQNLSPQTTIRVWPVASCAAGVALKTTGDESFLAVAWRPSSGQIGVLFKDRLELWDASAARRVLPLPTGAAVSSSRGATVSFRADGKAAFVSGVLATGTVAIDLQSGMTAPVPAGDLALEPAVSIRLQ